MVTPYAELLSTQHAVTLHFWDYSLVQVLLSVAPMRYFLAILRASLQRYAPPLFDGTPCCLPSQSEFTYVRSLNPFPCVMGLLELDSLSAKFFVGYPINCHSDDMSGERQLSDRSS